jgi:excisionase family DNA binding protein
MAEFYTTKQIAEMCGVHISTAIRWIDSGAIKAYRTPGGRRRVAAAELKSFIERLQIPVDKPIGRRRGRPKPLVLVVDDDELVLKAAQRQLVHVPCEVAVAKSGYDALLIVGERLPDLVVLDLKMPGLDGYEVCASIKRNPATQDVEVLAVSAECTPEVIERAKSLGAYDCMLKSDAFKRLPLLIGVRVRAAEEE